MPTETEVILAGACPAIIKDVPLEVMARPPERNVFIVSDTYTMADVERACAMISMEDPVRAVISVFYRTVNPRVKFGAKTVRRAAADVIAVFGPEGAVALAKCAVAYYHHPYFPKVTSPSDLADKMMRVASAVRRVGEEGVTSV
jgi:hypothetical protein